MSIKFSLFRKYLTFAFSFALRLADFAGVLKVSRQAAKLRKGILR